MHRGLTKKFDYEKGKQKAKAQNPDYKDDLAETRDTRDPGGFRTGPTLADIAKNPLSLHAAFLKDDKLKAIHEYRRRIQSTSIWVDSMKFHFKFTAEQFAKENRIPLIEAQSAFPSLKKLAEKALDASCKRAIDAPLEPVQLTLPSGKTRVYNRLAFKTFVGPVEPIDWSKPFAGILICPYQNEPKL